MGRTASLISYIHIGAGTCTEINHSTEGPALSEKWSGYANVVLSQVPSCHTNALLEELPFIQQYN